ncbi:MAG: hypothetical protein J6W13_09395 [Salinivirgaceae bacterium]|nr:hypothetical protein [Salinivirgaceae bacterium]
MVKDIKYRYALDEQGRTVCIDDVSDEYKMLHTYFCISCGAPVIPKRGKIKKWHFAHKGTEEHCDPETYLHKLAKRLIKEKFDNSNTFEISYYQDVVCSFKPNCVFAKKRECHAKMLNTFDLKKYYDTCKEEQTVVVYKEDEHVRFRADLLLTNSKNADRKPILIEIQVNHECEEQKKKSKLHIIEIRVKDEKGIIDLLNKTIEENYESSRDVDNIGFAKFYCFKRQSKESKPIYTRVINKFYLYGNGKSFVEPQPCLYVHTKINGRTSFEASIDSSDEFKTYKSGYLLAIQQGIITRACCFCKYHKNLFYLGTSSFCRFYKKYGTPKNPILTYAQQCEYYCENKEIIESIANHMPAYTIAK